MSPRTLYEKIWDTHVISAAGLPVPLLYIDRHFIHEATSPQAFAGLKAAGRKVRRPDLTFAVMDHSVPTKDRRNTVITGNRAKLFEALDRNCRETGVRLFDMNSKNQGIVHIIGPEMGITQPGQTIVCGDSHTSTHGAMGALAFGIGTSEVETVLATQCLPQYKSKTMLVRIEGKRSRGITAKDLMLAVIEKLGFFQRLSNEDIAAVETLQKLQQISAIMDDIAEGEMKEAIRQLTQISVETDPQKMNQEIGENQVTTEDIQKKLDRIISLLQQVKTIQEFEMAKNILEDLALKQALLGQKYEIAPEDTSLVTRREYTLPGNEENPGYAQRGGGQHPFAV